MTITLRQNQKEPIDKAIGFFRERNPKPSLIVLPTAWGKSILTAFVAKELGDKILVLQPSKELLEQNYKKYVSLCDFEVTASIYSASFGKKEINRVTYATIGSIKNVGKTFRNLGFKKMLIDEAHLYPREADSMLGRFIEESGITHVMGITATPIKQQQNTDLDGDRFSKLQMLTSNSKKGNFFRDIIHVSQVQEMVSLGFWSKLSYLSPGFDSSNLVYNSSRSEFTEESMTLSFGKNNISDKIINQLDINKDRKHILVFVPSVAEAIRMSKIYPASEAIYGDMDKDKRARVIDEFRRGNIRVIFNVRVLSTGFDYPGIDCIILGISTASMALYYQILGRGVRIDNGKEDCLVIDLAGNVDRFGYVEDISFEKDTIWRMYGTGGRLLSGIPIHDIGRVTRGNLCDLNKKSFTQKKIKPIETMPFGKYSGLNIRELPADYIQWCLNNIRWHRGNENLKQALQRHL